MHCNFCHIAHTDTEIMIAGRSGFICGKCVEVCVGVLVAAYKRDAKHSDVPINAVTS